MSKTITNLYTDNPVTLLAGTEKIEVATSAPASGATRVSDIKDYMQSVAFPSKTVATVGSASPGGRIIYVTDETGGPVLAYSDGTDWRRFSDGAVVS